mmetsp:Transcript_19410/g.61812  ORF Transcript_19410/g.61812 Transcript_19410/m.61812 type:complete len:217 (+) Transcript_19410:2540-3190(+)
MGSGMSLCRTKESRASRGSTRARHSSISVESSIIWNWRNEIGVSLVSCPHCSSSHSLVMVSVSHADSSWLLASARGLRAAGWTTTLSRSFLAGSSETVIPSTVSSSSSSALAQAACCTATIVEPQSTQRVRLSMPSPKALVMIGQTLSTLESRMALKAARSSRGWCSSYRWWPAWSFISMGLYAFSSACFTLEHCGQRQRSWIICSCKSYKPASSR